MALATHIVRSRSVTCDKLLSGGSSYMETVGRMMDSIAEAPQSQRSKPSMQAAGDTSELTGLSFADTMIGFVQPPSPQEPVKAAPNSSDMAGDAMLADVSTTEPRVMRAPPISTTLADVAKHEGLTENLQTPGAKGAAVPPGLLAEAAIDAGMEDANVTFKLGETLGLATEIAEGAILQTQALKTQAVASQILSAGLAALGQTQQLVAEDSELAQFAATATGQATQPSPLQTNSTTSQAGPTIDLMLAKDQQGPSAVRALEAQSGEARALKISGPTGWFGDGTGLIAADDAGLQSAPNAASAATPTQPATVAVTTGLLPNLAKAAAKAEETKVAATDVGGIMAGANGAADAASSTTTDWTSAPATDTSPKPTLVQPHTVPMLAAAMMRRISNGLKEFTLRLDPPELGRVDVRLTVGPDKKVRAVVSTDRPEALKDLALSARELTRALQEAGLELEENGLSFSMNDQGSSQQNRDANQQQSTRLKNSLDGYETSEAAKPEQAAPLSAHLSGPVERWQRARIAMTA
jgi:flagellar hook-length control protein FliK